MEQTINNPTTHSGYKCIFFGYEMHWESCESASELLDDYNDDDASTIWYFICPHCGCDYEVIEPKEEDKIKMYNEYWHL